MITRMSDAETTDRLLRACNWILADAKASLDYADQVLVSREVIGELREALRGAALHRVGEEAAHDELNSTPWVPIGYREEERTYFPLLTWSGKHMWWAIRLIGRLNPEWSSRLAIFALSYWPRFRYHILVGKLSVEQTPKC